MMLEKTNVLGTLLLCGCQAAQPAAAPTAARGATSTSAAPSPAPAKDVAPTPLRVGAAELRPKSAIFSWRDKANDMSVLITDADDPCAAISSGAWPRGATVLSATLKHNARADRDAPFAAGDYPLRRGAPIVPMDTKAATFLSLDASCSPVVRAKATDGVVRLSTARVEIGGVAEGTFDLTMEGGARLTGAFSAKYCAPPENEPQGCR